ncbi:MAG: potassium channel family protein [Bacteroidales bacterium]|mgnify:FL=1|jgi:voltage-gated potassium channel|nr:potassium channel family protein [Bacteroidales bacterium]MDG2082093.1 potassium channel family protein [Bacteroidales bacterium]|tara:strand:+ start:457 stop:1110 length:654 start_codon:yes stop_codon:yes gene_type:complete
MESIRRKVFGIDNGILLLLAIFAFVFVFPIIDNEYMHNVFVTTAYSTVLISIFSIIRRNNKLLSLMVIISIIANIISIFAQQKIVMLAVFIISAITFIIVAIILIKDIAASKNVDITVVIHAICGYLVIGIIGVLLNTLLLSYNPGAISISDGNDRFSSLIYYSFITLTTIGYGEIIPLSVPARSVSILMGVLGQIYLTVIIAMIVSKYMTGKKQTN